MATFRQAWQILAVALLGAGVTFAFHPRKPSFAGRRNGEVSLETIENWADRPIWVDARPGAEFARGHVPGAISLNVDDWDRQLPAFLDQWDPAKKVIVYCSSQSCQLATEIAERLRKNQVSTVYVLEGGWENWQAHHGS